MKFEPSWTADDEQKLRDAYSGASNGELAARFGRTVASIRVKANRLGLRKPDGHVANPAHDPALPLTAARLREVLAYDALTGIFTWRYRKGYVPAGSDAGTRKETGYIDISIDRRLYKAHRLAWMYVYGQWPTQMIDHINGVRDDNRIANLRDVTCSVNCQNRRSPRRNSKSPYLGITWEKAKSKWAAQIRSEGKVILLGYFDDPAVAHTAYVAAKRQLHAGCTI